jgi:hypothetical protein
VTLWKVPLGAVVHPTLEEVPDGRSVVIVPIGLASSK